MKIVFFGTPSFAAKVLNYLITHSVDVVAIVTKPDKARGRSKKLVYSAVKEFALENNLDIPIHQPEKASDPVFVDLLKKYKADLFVVVAYGEIVKQNLLEMPRLGCINLHASLLPKYRGASPIHAALLNGDRETGVTVIKMVEKMDAGDILGQKRMSISINMNFEELETKLYLLGQEVLLDVITQLQLGLSKQKAQKGSEASYVKKIDSSLAKIDWKEPANVLHNRVRAFSKKPGAWCSVEIKGQIKRLKIFLTSFCKETIATSKSTVAYGNGQWVIASSKGSLSLLEVQLEGKKRMKTEDFIRGNETPPLII